MFKDIMQVKGLFKYLVLYTLKDSGLHGYGIIQRISELFGGEYTPSPGVIYPTLQLLEDSDLVYSVKEGRKTIYYITEQGLSELESNIDRVEEVMDIIRRKRRVLEELGGYELMSIFKDLMTYYPILNDEKKRMIREAAREFRNNIDRILRGDYHE